MKIVSVITLTSLVALLAGGTAKAVGRRNDHVDSAGISPSLQVAALESLAQRTNGIKLDREGCTGTSNDMRTCFTKDGVEFSAHGEPSVRLTLSSFGRKDLSTDVPKIQPRTLSDKVQFEHNGFVEWWKSIGNAYEQGFEISRRPKGKGKLEIVLTSNVPAAFNGYSAEWKKLKYGNLAVVDAHGAGVPSKMSIRGSDIVLTVDDALSAYPLLVDPVVWIQQQKLTSSDGAANDYFGGKVALLGEKAFVGAFQATVGSNAYQGAVYLFQKSGSTWIQTQKIVSSDGAALDFFGANLAVNPSTGTLVVSAYNKQVGTAAQAGTIYTFDNNLGSYIQTQEITATDAAYRDMFGISVATNGDIIVAGSSAKTVTGVVDAGKLYIYRRPSGGSWALSQTIVTSTGQEELFAGNVVISGTTIFVGAGNYQSPGAAYISGAVYIYNKSTLCAVSTPCWTLSQRIVPAVYNDSDAFSNAMATDGSTLLVSSPFYAPGGAYSHRNQGTVYVFQLSGGLWSQTQQLLASDGSANNLFGRGLAISGTTALIGAPRSSGFGSAYSFTSSGGIWSQSQEFSASDGASGDAFGSSISTSGNTALVGAGQATVAGATLRGAAYLFGQ